MHIPSFNRVIIDSTKLEHNFRYIRGTVGEQVRIMAMVKSDGYGHGMVDAANAFIRGGCEMFGVAEISEAVALRESGCQKEILVFLGFDSGAVDYFFSHNLNPVLFTEEDLQLLATTAAQKDQKIGIYLKFDCGMSRLGYYPAQFPELLNQIKDEPFIELLGIMSHYPRSDERESLNTQEVYRTFNQLKIANNETAPVYSICNSGGTLYFPETHGEMVRPGISLYGYYPDGAAGRPEDRDGGLLPAMSFVSRVLQVRDITAGTGISYGHTFVAERDMKLAVLPVGYSDGYLRGLSNRAEVLIGGQRAPICGRVCMNLCMADITGLNNVQPGDEVVLLGPQGEQMIDADEIGSWCDTISYEILCSIGNSNERVII